MWEKQVNQFKSQNPKVSTVEVIKTGLMSTSNPLDIKMADK